MKPHQLFQTILVRGRMLAEDASVSVRAESDVEGDSGCLKLTCSGSLGTLACLRNDPADLAKKSRQSHFLSHPVVQHSP
jgi:hypothetical protein